MRVEVHKDGDRKCEVLLDGHRVASLALGIDDPDPDEDPIDFFDCAICESLSLSLYLAEFLAERYRERREERQLSEIERRLRELEGAK